MSMEVLSRHWEELKRKKNYLNSMVGTKVVNGIDTGVPAIVVYVKKKLPMAELSNEDVIPQLLDGVRTDVIELAPTTWIADRTSMSELHPAEQLHHMGLRPTPPALKNVSLTATSQLPSGASDWTKFDSPVQDQGNCGSCPAFGITGTWECKLRLVANNPALNCKLSEAHLFFCTPGCNCDTGSNYPNILSQAEQGVCLESCLPYKAKNQACAAGICQNWWTTAYKLAGYNVITDPTMIKLTLDTEPLAVSMAVYHSFNNYVSGVYKKLPNDVLDGYHAIENAGYSDFLGADLIKNSWGTGWGKNCMVNGVRRSGYCWLAYGQLEPERYQLLPDGPVPAPPNPPPVPPAHKCWLLKLLKK